MVRARRRRGGYLFASGVGFVAGAAAGYWLDPRSGRHRRALVQDSAVRAAHDFGELVDKGGRDLAQRAHGLAAEAAARLRSERVDDTVLAERVRAELGRVCSHPHAITVEVCDGVVELRGPILEREHRAVRAGITRVRGVKRVSDRLELHARADRQALQGGVPRYHRSELQQANWSPGVRLIVGGVGAILAANAVRRRTPSTLASTVAGVLLLLRSCANLPLKRVFGVGAGRRVIDLQKELRIDAPIEDVYGFFSHFENFPRFMTHVREVRRIDDRRWHWEVEGPAGMRFGWDAEVHLLAPNERLGWRSLPGALVASSGVVRFEQHQQGGTRLNIRLQYNPPGGVIGHAFARLLGADPKTEMDDDLLRLKSLLETGRARGRNGRITRDEIR
jgi:uncharacterized membrane protein